MQIEILKKAKTKAKLLFSSVLGVEGFGIGDECVCIYVQNAEVKTNIPNQIDGITIKCIITGKIESY